MTGTTDTSKNKLLQRLILLLWVGAILANIKSIFADFDYDSAYAIAMSYRNLIGDSMFLTMWEPHQTSGFLLTALEAVFLRITGGTPGIVIYLQTMSVLIYGGVTWLLFRFFRRYEGSVPSHLACILFFTFRPKQLVLLEFSNMQILFSALLFLSLMEYLSRKNRLFLVIAALMLCLEVLSYPACAIAFPVVLLILFFCSETRAKDILTVSAVCLICGGLYLAYFCFRLGPSGLLEIPSKLTAADSFHSGALLSVFEYLKEFLLGIGWLSACCLLSLLLSKLIRKLDFYIAFGILLATSDIALLFLTANGGRYAVWMFGYGMLLLLMILMGFLFLPSCDAQCKRIFFSGVSLSASSFFAVLLLTNLSLISVVQYLILGGVVSLFPICRALQQKRSRQFFFLPMLLCLTVIMHRGLALRDYSQASATILGIRNIVRSGPSAGIVCGYLAYYQNKCDYPVWREQVKADDSLLIVTHWTVDSSLYLYSPASVSHYSTISTPTYDETLLSYWELYPEKVPTVLAVECWYGTSYMDPQSFIMQWIDENYEPVCEGTYWWFYRRKDRPSGD